MHARWASGRFSDWLAEELGVPVSMGGLLGAGGGDDSLHNQSHNPASGASTTLQITTTGIAATRRVAASATSATSLPKLKGTCFRMCGILASWLDGSMCARAPA